MDLQQSALLRSELRLLAASRPTGTPSTFERPPREQTADPSTRVLAAQDGSSKAVARSTFRRSRVRVTPAAAAASRPQSAPARSSSGYLPLKRRHFPSELRGAGSTTQLGAGLAVSGVAHTASQDSIGRSSSLSARSFSAQRPRRRRRRPQPRGQSEGSDGGTIERERSFVPHEYGVDGPEWRAISFAGDDEGPLEATAAQTEGGVAQWVADAEQQQDVDDESAAFLLLPDTELISAGRPVPEKLLTIRAEYADDLSKIVNHDAYEAYISFVTEGWPGWTAPRRGAAHGGTAVTDSPDPRVATPKPGDEQAANADWMRIEETARWLETLVPQSRLDAYPVYVLCRDLLRQVMQREFDYHDARNVALSDLVAELREEVASMEAAAVRAAEVAAAREKVAEARRQREADAAEAERVRLEQALEAALAEGVALREQLAMAEAERAEADAAAKTEEYRANRLDKQLQKSTEESGAKISSLESIVTDATQLRNAMRRIAVDGSDDDKAKKRALFLNASLGLLTSADVDLSTTAIAELFKSLGPQLPLASVTENPWRLLGRSQRLSLLQALLRTGEPLPTCEELLGCLGVEGKDLLSTLATEGLISQQGIRAALELLPSDTNAEAEGEAEADAEAEAEGEAEAEAGAECEAEAEAEADDGPYAEEEDEPSDAAAGSDGGDRVGGDEAAGT